MAKDAYWFRHDSNASADPKIVALVGKYGMAGKGLYWTLIEILREQENYQYNISQKFAYSSLADPLKLTTDQCINFINDLVDEFQLIKRDDHCIYSESLVRRMSEWDEKKKVLSERGRKGAEVANAKKAAQALQPSSTSEENSHLTDSTSENIPSYKSIEEEKRGNKKKERENKNTGSHTQNLEINKQYSEQEKKLIDHFKLSLNTNYPSLLKMKKPFTEEEMLELMGKYSIEIISHYLKLIEEKGLAQKAKSAIWLFNDLIAKEFNKNMLDKLEANRNHKKRETALINAKKEVTKFLGTEFMSKWEVFKAINNEIPWKDQMDSFKEEEYFITMLYNLAGCDFKQSFQLLEKCILEKITIKDLKYKMEKEKKEQLVAL